MADETIAPAVAGLSEESAVALDVGTVRTERSRDGRDEIAGLLGEVGPSGGSGEA